MSFVVLLLVGLTHVISPSAQSITESLLQETSTYYNNNQLTNKENTTNNVTTFNSTQEREFPNFSKENIKNRLQEQSKIKTNLEQSKSEDSLNFKEENKTHGNTNSWKGIKENNVLGKEEGTIKGKNVREIPFTDSFDATFEYSEEDMSVGVHTLGSEEYTLDSYMANRRTHTSSRSSAKGGGSKFADEVKAFHQLLQDSLVGRNNIPALMSQNNGALFTQNNGPQQFFLPTNCLVEWQECSSDEDCCRSLYCSELPSLNSIYNLNESTALEIRQFCSRYKSTFFRDFKNRSDIHTIINIYKRQMLDALNS